MTHPEEGRQEDGFVCGSCAGTGPTAEKIRHRTGCQHPMGRLLVAPEEGRQPKTYADGLREAAEIARDMARVQRTNMDGFDHVAALQCEVVAEAIESKLAEGER